MSKKLISKKRYNFIMYSVVYLFFLLINIITFGYASESLQNSNIYVAIFIGSPFVTIGISQLFMNLIFEIKDDTERKTVELNLLHLHYIVQLTYLITFIVCSFIAKTFELIPLILATAFAIIGNFTSVIKINKPISIFNELIKNEEKSALFQRPQNWILLILGTILLSRVALL